MGKNFEGEGKMEGILTLKNIVTLLVVLCALWLAKVIIRRESENLPRSLIITLFFAVALVFIERYDIRRLDLKELKEKFFPEKNPVYNFHVEEGTGTNTLIVRYIFDEPQPKLSLVLDSSGKYFHIKDITPINRVLDYLGRHKVSSGVKELASLTGSRYDTNLYRWEDYAEGVLIMERTVCHDKRRYESYNCIASITIRRRY